MVDFKKNKHQLARPIGTPRKKGTAMGKKPTSSESEAIEGEASDMEMTPEERGQMASSLVDRFALWSGVAGLIPLPVVDILAVGGLQIQLLRRISQIYNVPFSENRGKALIASIVGTMIPTTSGMGAASALKSVPIIGTVAAGFVMPVLSAGATYAIGKAFIQHFASGGTLLDFNPPDYREFIRAHKDMWESRSSRGAQVPQSSSPDKTGAAATSS
jgi:uncharacterized protein (DUF697 family)